MNKSFRSLKYKINLNIVRSVIYIPGKITEVYESLQNL